MGAGPGPRPGPSTGPRARSALATALAAALLAGCSGPATSTEVTRHDTARGGSSAAVVRTEPVEPDLDAAVSEPVEDSLYPGVGDPGVDALHYDLDLAWEPASSRLTGTATITFRATADAALFQLDLASPLEVTRSTLDGQPVTTRHSGKDLQVLGRVSADVRHELVLEYSGTPRPTPAPTTRSDFSTTGFTVTEDGEVWTMQEPYGAFTWYPVNDHPSDKALYDVTVSAPAPWTGISNGRLLSRETTDGTTTTQWQLDEPAASYLVTLAIGDYAHTSNTSASGVRIDYWVPRGTPVVARDLRVAASGLDWVEERLGPYPFSSLGFVVVDSRSAMETQTMVTLGNTTYPLSPPVVVHELVHQWYGDQVSPADWRDVWLNEGMTMLLQWMWESDNGGEPLEQTVGAARSVDADLRDAFGPPGDYDPDQFGSSNIYYVPALMWNELRLELGDEEFFAVARSWLTDNDNTSATREELYAHWEAETGRELSGFFDAWIEGATTPARGVPD